MDATEHAIREGYLTPEGALTEAGLEAFALGQGPFALRIIDQRTGERVHVVAICGRCGGTCEENEASIQASSPGSWHHITVCPACAG